MKTLTKLSLIHVPNISGCSRRASSSRTSTAAARWRSGRRSRRRARTCSSTRRRCAASSPSSRRRTTRIRCTFSGVVALSYAWVTPADPDPERAQLRAAPAGARVVDVRARAAEAGLGTMASWAPTSPTPRSRRPTSASSSTSCRCSSRTTEVEGGPPSATHVQQEARAAGVVRPRAAQHRPAVRPRGTTVFKLTATPLPAGRRSRSRLRPARLDAPRAAPRRPRGAGVEQPRRGGVADGRGRSAPPGEGRGKLVLGRQKPRRRSAGRRSCASRRRSSPRRATTTKRQPGDAGRADPRRPRRAGEPCALRGGAQGEGLQRRRRCKIVCAGLYRGVAEPLLAGVEELEFAKLAWTAADWRHMGGALACCTKLRKLQLDGWARTGADDAAMAARARAAPALKARTTRGAPPGRRPRARRGARARTSAGSHWRDRATSATPSRAARRPRSRRSTSDNKIGDEGMRHLGDALARGAAPALKELNLTLFTNQQQDRRRGDAPPVFIAQRIGCRSTQRRNTMCICGAAGGSEGGAAEGHLLWPQLAGCTRRTSPRRARSRGGGASRRSSRPLPTAAGSTARRRQARRRRRDAAAASCVGGSDSR